MKIASPSPQSVFQTLANNAKQNFVSGQEFKVSFPDTSGGAGSEQLSGRFQYTEAEPVGDDSLFTPGDPSAFDAGKQAFSGSLENFLMLAPESSKQAGYGSSPNVATYDTSTSFSGNGVSIAWSGEFSLVPSDPKSGSN
jgi:hypothetical protein